MLIIPAQIAPMKNIEEINESIFTTNLVPYKNHFYDIIIPTFTITFNEIPN